MEQVIEQSYLPHGVQERERKVEGGRGFIIKPLHQNPLNYEFTNGLIHSWGQSPYDPITSPNPHLQTLLHRVPSLHHISFWGTFMIQTTTLPIFLVTRKTQGVEFSSRYHQKKFQCLDIVDLSLQCQSHWWESLKVLYWSPNFNNF